MDIYYFDGDRTPHLSHLIRELCLVKNLPFTVDEKFQCDTRVNDFFLALVVPQSPSPNTWGTYAEQLSMFFRFLSSRNTTWRDATQDDLRAYYRCRRVIDGPLNISSRSWNVFTAAVRRFYEWAKKNKHLAVVPFDLKEIKSGSPTAAYGATIETTDIRERDRKKDIKYMTEEDFRQRFLPVVTNTKEGIRNALFVRLLTRSGLRADEAVKLKLEALPDPDNTTYAGRKTCPLTVLGKGNKTRTVRVPKSWLRDAARYVAWDREDAVDRWKAAHPKGDAAKDGHLGYLFLTGKGTTVTYSAFYKMMRVAGRKSGFDFRSHPHMLRHSYAVYQLSAMIKVLLNTTKDAPSSTEAGYRGMVHDPLRKLQRLLGHSSIVTTFIYLDYVDDIDDMVDVTMDEEGFEPEDGYENVRASDVEK